VAYFESSYMADFCGENVNKEKMAMQFKPR
jgi:hypothetical protein